MPLLPGLEGKIGDFKYFYFLQGFQNLVGMFDIFSIPTRSKKDLAGVIRSFIFLVGKDTDCKSALSFRIKASSL